MNLNPKPVINCKGFGQVNFRVFIFENGNNHTYFAERFTMTIHIYRARHLGVTPGLHLSSHPHSFHSSPLSCPQPLPSGRPLNFSHDHSKEVPFPQRIQFRLLLGLYGCLKPSPADLSRFSHTSDLNAPHSLSLPWAGH